MIHPVIPQIFRQEHQTLYIIIVTVNLSFVAIFKNVLNIKLTITGLINTPLNEQNIVPITQISTYETICFIKL